MEGEREEGKQWKKERERESREIERLEDTKGNHDVRTIEQSVLEQGVKTNFSREL